MDAALLDELEAQHRQVEELFSRLERAHDETTQQPLVDELTAALTQHMDIEERDVYPELNKLDEEMGEEAENEHNLARDGLTTLESMIGEPGFGAAVAMLKAGIAHHVKEEEGEVFPKLRQTISEASSRG